VLLLSTILSSLLLSTLLRFLVESSLTDRVSLLSDLVGLQLQENAGIAFGIGLSLPLLLLLAAFAVLLLLRAALHAQECQEIVGYGLILGGALANLLDRVDDGVVTDFLQVGTFPVFNLADSCIAIGVLLILAKLAQSRSARTRRQ